ncbi:MAG: relaxase MobL [Roseburia sp.]|nr:relaxase MobL [Roseburia sp.]
MKAIFNIGYTTATPPASYTGERRANYIAERNFYNLTAEYNYFTYTLNGQKVAKNANAEHYFTREGTNTGLFNMDGAIDEQKKNELKARLKDTESTIWHGFISFDDETSRGFTNQENCVKFMNQTFGAFLERAGFKKSNIELYCSLHEDTAHRHIHFAFFEKEPLRLDKNGNLGFTRKGKISPVVIDNYLVSANMHLSEHGAEYYTARDRALTEMNRLRETKARTGFIDSRASTAALMLNVELNRLIAKLPKNGRLQYNAKGMEALRPDIDKIADLLIRSDARAFEAHGQMLKELARVENEVKQLSAEGKLGYVNGKRMTAADISAFMDDGPMRNKSIPLSLIDMQNVDYFERLRGDYKARIGNIVLGMCKDILHSESHENRRVMRVNDLHRKIRAKHNRRYRKDLLRETQSAIGAICYQERANFLKTVQQHERDIEFEKMQGSAAG